MTGSPIVPRIRRARGFRLYDEAGKRYVDLYQAGGSAVLGHRGPGAVREIKDALSRGLGPAFPSVYEARMKKLLRRLFPSYGSAELYSCLHRGLDAASLFLGRRIDEEDVLDPALSSGDAAGACASLRAPALGRPWPRAGACASYWRPFLPDEACWNPEVLIPILPSGGIQGFTAVCYRTRAGERVPEGDTVSACLLAGALRAASDLQYAVRAENAVTRAVDAAGNWRRMGPYISPAFEEQAYAEVFRAFLDAGYLLNPYYPGPSIVPGELSPGEAAGLCRLFKDAEGG
jgi:hypothetical protein